MEKAKLKFTIKRTEYQEVIIDSYHGYNEMKTIKEVVDMVKAVENDPLAYAESANWEYGENVIDGEIEIIELEE